MRWRWVALGALAVLGTYYLYVRLLLALHVWPPHAYFYGVAIAGLGGGAAIARHAIVVPWREPIAAALATIALFVGLHALSPYDVPIMPGGVPAILLAVALVIGGAAGGAAIVRTLLGTHTSGAAIVVLDAQLLGGLVALIYAAMTITGFSKSGFVPFLVVAIALAGALTQLVAAVRAPWLCGGGSGILVLVMMAGNRAPASLVGGFIAMWAVGALGAVIAWRVANKRAPEVAVPPARLS